MTRPLALFVDLCRTTLDAWPDRSFDLAYIVTADLERTQALFKTHHAHLKTIPHITAEITDRETLHLVTRLPVVTRISLPYAWIPDGLQDHFAVDAIINWDRRRPVSYYKNVIDTLVTNKTHHISFYNVPDFEIWQDIQKHVNDAGLFFYDRFHSATPGHESLYQRHTLSAGNILAYGGWSRITENDVMRTRDPRAKQFKTLSPDDQRLERIILGMSDRTGLPVHIFIHDQITLAVSQGLATVHNYYLCPTDTGLWENDTLVHLLS